MLFNWLDKLESYYNAFYKKKYELTFVDGVVIPDRPGVNRLLNVSDILDVIGKGVSMTHKHTNSG